MVLSGHRSIRIFLTMTERQAFTTALVETSDECVRARLTVARLMWLHGNTFGVSTEWLFAKVVGKNPWPCQTYSIYLEHEHAAPSTTASAITLLPT